MIVTMNRVVSSLSFTFAPMKTPSVSNGLVVLNSQLFISGTDIASGCAFAYTHTDSL